MNRKIKVGDFRGVSLFHSVPSLGSVGLMALILFFTLQATPARVFGSEVPSEVRAAGDLSIQIYADKVKGARSMALGEDGTVYVGTRDEGQVYALRDLDRDGMADEIKVIAEGLRLPNGVAVLGGDLYVAENSRIIRIPKASLEGRGHLDPVVIYDGFPSKIMHGWKALAAGPDGWLYFSVGVPCNICSPEAPYEGRLLRLQPQTRKLEFLAEGLRNSVGLTFHPVTHELWLTDNGRDYLGDNRPPDELNHFKVPGSHFGYPFCFGKDQRDPELGQDGGCQRQTPPEWEFPAHVAPVGLHFYEGSLLPERFRNQLLVAEHGSWNRSEPQGYRVVMIRFQKGHPVSESVVVDGWLTSEHKVLGRPVDLLELKDGSLLISDDYADRIYRLTSK